jgi:hypothetical protein
MNAAGVTNAAGQAAASSVAPATPAAGCAYGIPQALPGSTMASAGAARPIIREG